MQLIIPRTTNNKEFSNWILKLAKQEILSNLDHKKLRIYENYIKEHNIFEFDQKSLGNLNLTHIVYIYVRTLKKEEYKQIYKYTFNNTIKYSNTEYIDIIKFINYGNSEIKGYPFIINVFSNIQNNIKEYEEMYTVMNEL